MTKQDLDRIESGNFYGPDEAAVHYFMKTRPEGRALLDEAIKATPEALRVAIDYLKARNAAQ